MAEIDSRTSMVIGLTNDAKEIRDKIAEIAENKGIEIEEGVDTPLSVLDKFYILNDAKPIIESSLNNFVAEDYNATYIAPYKFYGSGALQSIDLTGVTQVGNYVFYNCSNATSLTFGPDPTQIGNYAFGGCTSLTEVIGNFSDVGTYAFSNDNAITKLHIKISGSVGTQAFNNLTAVSDLSIDPTSNITSLNTYAFGGVGLNRINPSSNRLIFDFSNSSFTTMPNYVFGNNQNTMATYVDVHFPSTVDTVSNMAFRYSQYYNLYWKSVPNLLNVNAFASASNFKNFFSYNILNQAKTATNWSSSTNGISASIYGYAPANTFELNETLPSVNPEGYPIYWYSDTTISTRVYTVDDPTKIYYCNIVGSKVSSALNIKEYQATCVLSASGTTYTSGDLIPIGTTVTITATPEGNNDQIWSFTLNGTNITSGSTYTVTSNDINIICYYYDGVNIPVLPTFADNIPASIKYAVDNGLHRTLWNVGDYMVITLANNTVAKLVYIDQKVNRYEKTDGTGYSNAVFQLDPLTAKGAYNSSYPVAWANSAMCTSTMPTMKSYLPAEWQNVISQVKVYSASSSTGALSSANNYCFIPAGQEIWGDDFVNSFYYDESASIFDINIGATTTDLRRTYNGTNTSYWTRSPYYGYSSTGPGQACVAADGGRSGISTSNTNTGICVCFAI